MVEQAGADGGPCDGWVGSLQGQTLAFTGKVLVDGYRTLREDCAAMAMALGARGWKTDFSRKVTLLVHGDLASQVVTDLPRNYSKKLVRASWERDRGFHVCVIDAAGFSDLLDGFPARCRELHPVDRDSGKVLVLQQTGDGILGGPLSPHEIPRRDHDFFVQDLGALDRGTEVHEATVSALIEHLRGEGVEVRSHARRAPQFDAGWCRDGIAYVAEVKSLTGASEVQQIRLGLGQILDYTHQLEQRPTFGEVQPVLVLDKQPSDSRWESLFSSLGVVLTWGRTFPGC